MLVPPIPVVVELGKNPALGDSGGRNRVGDFSKNMFLPPSLLLENNLVLGDSVGGNGVWELSDGITPVSDHYHIVVSSQQCHGH